MSSSLSERVASLAFAECRQTNDIPVIKTRRACRETAGESLYILHKRLSDRNIRRINASMNWKSGCVLLSVLAQMLSNKASSTISKRRKRTWFHYACQAEREKSCVGLADAI